MQARHLRLALAAQGFLALGVIQGCPAAAVAPGALAFTCEDDADCSTGHVCVDGLCQPSGTVSLPDAAALDQPASDGAAPDISAADRGGSDSLATDAGPGDRSQGDVAAADGPNSDQPGLDAAGEDLPGDAANPVDATGHDTVAADAGAGDSAGTDTGPEDGAAACPTDWWDCAWSDRLKLTFDTSQLAEPLADFPVLVHLTRSRVDLDRIASGGADLRFVDPQGQQLLPHEIERWSDGLEGWIWVRVPQLDASSTTDHIWMYFDSAGAADAQDPAQVWSQGFRAVWHLDGSAASSIGLPGANPTSSVRSSGSEGVAGRGLTLDGVDDRVLLTASDAVLGSLTDLTLSAWVRRDDVDPNWQGILSVRRTGEIDFSEGNFVFHGYADSFGLENNNPFPSSWRAELATPRQWHLLSVTVDTASHVALLYLDGREVLRFSEATTPTWNDQNELRLGARHFGGNEQSYLAGAIDEVRVAHVTRSATWQRAEYLSQSDALLRYGEEPWLRPGHGRRIKLQLLGAQLEENLHDFPVLVTLDSSVVDYARIQDDADDLRFLDADGTVLDHQIDSWNEGGTSQIWVRVPQVNAYNVTDAFWMYYDNPAVTGSENASGVWSGAYVGVWHLGDLADSTSHGNHGTDHGSDPGTGLVGGARDLDDNGEEQHIAIADSPSLDAVADELTASLWMYRQNGQTDWACGLAREMGNGGLNIFWLGFTNDEYMFITSRAGAEQRLYTPGVHPPQGAWFALAGTYNGHKMRLFADGVQVAVIDRTGVLPPDDNPASLGGDTNDHGGAWGETPEALLDEARLQSVARSPAWMLAEHRSMTGALILADAPQQP